AVPRALPGAPLAAPRLRLRHGGRGAAAHRAGSGSPGTARAPQGRRDRSQPGGAVQADKGFSSRQRKDLRMESTLRLISANPVDRLARTVEALLVVASAPLSIHELCDATEDHPERIETAIGLLRERYREGRSGIVLEAVSGGYAFRASRDAADACARLFE